MYHNRERARRWETRLGAGVAVGARQSNVGFGWWMGKPRCSFRVIGIWGASAGFMAGLCRYNQGSVFRDLPRLVAWIVLVERRTIPGLRHDCRVAVNVRF